MLLFFIIMCYLLCCICIRFDTCVCFIVIHYLLCCVLLWYHLLLCYFMFIISLSSACSRCAVFLCSKCSWFVYVCLFRYYVILFNCCISLCYSWCISIRIGCVTSQCCMFVMFDMCMIVCGYVLCVCLV